MVLSDSVVDFSLVPECSDALPEGSTCQVNGFHSTLFYSNLEPCLLSPILVPGFVSMNAVVQTSAPLTQQPLLSWASPTVPRPTLCLFATLQTAPPDADCCLTCSCCAFVLLQQRVPCCLMPCERASACGTTKPRSTTIAPPLVDSLLLNNILALSYLFFGVAIPTARLSMQPCTSWWLVPPRCHSPGVIAPSPRCVIAP